MIIMLYIYNAHFFYEQEMSNNIRIIFGIGDTAWAVNN